MMRLLVALTVLAIVATPVLAAPGKNTPTATAIHGLPGNNPANGGQSANPNGQGPTGGGRSDAAQ